MSCDVCSDYLSGPLRTPMSDLDYAVVTPFVEVTVSAGGKKITVGNESMPPDNTCSILSFEYGAIGVSGSGGLSMKIEIIDEKGGEFHRFAESLWTCMTSTGSSTVTAKWGWIGLNCDGSTNKIPSPNVTGILVAIDVSFMEGKVKYNLNCTDIGPVTQHARAEKTFGSENDKIPITQAIRQLCQEVEPKCSVEFRNLRRKKSLEFEINGEEGPKHYWPCKQGSKIQVITSWLHDFKTIDKRGFSIINDNTKSDPTLIVTEQMNLEEGDTYEEDTSLGTFIVNGGECSVVLDFTTNFNWLLATSRWDSGGAMDQNGQAIQTKPTYNDTEDATSEQPNAGVSTQTIINQRSLEVYDQNDAGEKTAEANRENIKSIPSSGGGTPVDAQLRIMGNPSSDFVYTVLVNKMTCGLIVINPFGLSQEGECANWLQTSQCNNVLSNKFWVIQGCNHMIKDGSYTTTFKLQLPVAMAHFKPGTPAGGSNSNGFSDFKCS